MKKGPQKMENSHSMCMNSYKQQHILETYAYNFYATKILEIWTSTLGVINLFL